MSTWDQYRLSCVHGVREGLDYHDCVECRKLTTELYGSSHPTMLYLKDPKKKSETEVKNAR